MAGSPGPLRGASPGGPPVRTPLQRSSANRMRRAARPRWSPAARRWNLR